MIEQTKIPFKITNHGELIQGYVLVEDVKQRLKHDSIDKQNRGDIKIYLRNVTHHYDWKLIKVSNGVQGYINREMPEYLI